MNKIYLILMHTNTIPSRIIRFFTMYPYSHVGISLKRDCDTIYSFGRKKVNSILDSGFVIEHKNGEFFNKFNNTKCKIYELKVDEEQYKELKEILYNMEINADNYKYDFTGIIPRFLGIPITIKSKYVCSFFVADILEKSGIYKFNKQVCFIKPKDFENLNGCNEIYTGYYNLYE